MKCLMLRFIALILLVCPVALSARCTYRATCKPACSKPVSCCSIGCCNSAPFCGPYPRPLPGQYASFKDNTKINFWNCPPCAPRNDSKERGYLYKGIWWDNAGVRYWAFRNNTNNTITIEALEGGEMKDIPAGDVVNIARGESYSFRIQAPARRFELFASDDHMIEVFINLRGDIDYRVELPPVKAAQSKNNTDIEKTISPKF